MIDEFSEIVGPTKPKFGTDSEMSLHKNFCGTFINTIFYNRVNPINFTAHPSKLLQTPPYHTSQSQSDNYHAKS